MTCTCVTGCSSAIDPAISNDLCPMCEATSSCRPREIPPPPKPSDGDEALLLACAWSDYRADYGVGATELTAAHKAFKAGWAAHRDGDTRGPLR